MRELRRGGAYWYGVKGRVRFKLLISIFVKSSHKFGWSTSSNFIIIF